MMNFCSVIVFPLSDCRKAEFVRLEHIPALDTGKNHLAVVRIDTKVDYFALTFRALNIEPDYHFSNRLLLIFVCVHRKDACL